MRAAPAILAMLLLPLPAAAAERLPDYDREVRPVLEKHCFKCHSAESAKGGLRLDERPRMLRGGDSGAPAVVPGSSHKSHLIDVVTADDDDVDKMPPKGDRLKVEEVALLRKWIDTGAHGAAADSASVTAPETVAPGRPITDEDRAFWSFVPPRASEPPAIQNTSWPRTRIDQFLLSRMESANLAPSPEAPRETLIRRVTFDLTGLPPIPDDVRAFVADASPDACDKLVDRLLASPAYGQRMASLWLPLARYAEDQAHQVGSDTKLFYPNAYKYRDWVVTAFNRDLPYDRFVAYQIAADQVPGAAREDLAALGFLGLGPKYYNRGRLDVMADEWEDRVDTVTRTTMGLTVACARCHDHKFDPISAADYHAIAGVFASTRMVNKTPAGVVSKDAKAEEVPADALHVVEDGAPQDLNLFVRGNVERKGPIVPRGFLSILPSNDSVGQTFLSAQTDPFGNPFSRDPKGERQATPQASAQASIANKPLVTLDPFARGSGRRALAAAIASPANPLTARVMVNRVWAQFFGQHLVNTPSNFGHSGQPPSHQALLDDLAVRFVQQGWSIKTLAREIVTSAAYRQSSLHDATKAAIDPANERLWRMNRRRLTVEQWRDSLLFVSNELNRAGGKSIDPEKPDEKRRTLYSRISRLSLNSMLMQFDYPDANVHAERRATTVTPGQKLTALNGPFALARAKAFAARIELDVPDGIPGLQTWRVRRAYEVLFGRRPTERELAAGLAYLDHPADPAGLTRWERYAQALMTTNEAMYVD